MGREGGGEDSKDNIGEVMRQGWGGEAEGVAGLKRVAFGDGAVI